MRTYDLYLLGPLTDVIVGWHKFESEHDGAALALATGMEWVGTNELWRNEVLVKRWEHPNIPPDGLIEG